MKSRITIERPKPRVEDWRIKLDGQTVGMVWRCRESYRASVDVEELADSYEDGVKKVKAQIKRLKL